MSDVKTDKSDSNFSTRVQLILSTWGFPSIAALAKFLGHERSESLSRLHRSPGAKPSADILEDFANKFDDLNLEWLLTGRGEPRVAKGGRSRPAETQLPRSEPRVITLAPDGEPNIVMLDSRAAAGLPAHYGDPEFFADKPVFNLPGWKFRGTGMIALQVTGDSMAPTIHHDDWIIARHLPNPAEELKEGYVHLLVTKDGAVAKRIFRASNGRHALICKSDNEDYPPYEAAIGPHDQLYVALGLISEDLSNKGGGVRDRLRQLEKDVLVLQHALKIK